MATVTIKVDQEYRTFSYDELKKGYTPLLCIENKEERSNTERKKAKLPFLKILTKEVMNQPIRKRKKFFKITLKTLTMMLMLIPMKAHAQSVYTIPIMTPTTATSSKQKLKYPIIDQLYDLEFIPSDLVTMLIQLLYASPILGAVLAILFIMGAGVLIAIGKRGEAEQLTKNTLLGLCQILVAPALILLLTALTMIILGSVGGVSLFK